MYKSEIDPKILGQIKKLEEKYEVMGQDLSSYLDGLLYADYLTYWDYIHLDTLLSLQTPKTNFPDEHIFIIYHQITELYFKLVLLEIGQLAGASSLEEDVFIGKLKRIVNYFEHLEHSFSVMIEGMEPGQFLKFRMSLLPASGFQSAQYRMIEIASTDMANLVAPAVRDAMATGNPTMAQLLDNIYWKNGATELATGQKTLTLKQFEQKYHQQFLAQATDCKSNNINQLYQKHFQASPNAEEIKALLRRYDLVANVHWPLAHYKSAARYLQRDPSDIAATGGTNWQKYLPPRFQQVMFFPSLWSGEEKANWGKQWVMKQVFDK